MNSFEKTITAMIYMRTKTIVFGLLIVILTVQSVFAKAELIEPKDRQYLWICAGGEGNEKAPVLAVWISDVGIDRAELANLSWLTRQSQ